MRPDPIMRASPFIRTIAERGFLHQCTDLAALDAMAANHAITAYVGFDATADSLHIGNLVSIMLLHWLQRTGHRPIVLMGGGTTKVGDPSGKDESRALLSDDQIADNIKSIRRTFANFLHFGDGASDAILVNNDEWLAQLGYISFLRDVGRHFSVNRMLGLESVKLRLEREQPLSFLEFNYMVLQAYDFVELNRRFDCTVQMGGSDQWGNIVSGVDLARRLGGAQLFGLTSPLVCNADGTKMGKTVRGAVWLNPDRLSSYDYWQYWRNTDDVDVGRFLRLFTDVPLDDVARLEALRDAEINEAKKVLATEATRLCHGDAEADAAAETARQTFEAGRIGDTLPSVSMDCAELAHGIAAFALFARVGQLTKTEARKLIRGGGGRLNDQPVDDENRPVTMDDVGAEGVIKVSVGKKRHYLVRPT